MNILENTLDYLPSKQYDVESNWCFQKRSFKHRLWKANKDSFWKAKRATAKHTPGFTNITEGSVIQLSSHNLEPLRYAIEASRWILNLKDDWDDQGSPSYSEAVWQRATEFLRRSAEWLLETHDLRFDVPKIFPGPEGSIDLLWTTSHFKLLLNVPADPTQPASFYGEDDKDHHFKGTFDLSAQNKGLLLWLAIK